MVVWCWWCYWWCGAGGDGGGVVLVVLLMMRCWWCYRWCGVGGAIGNGDSGVIGGVVLVVLLVMVVSYEETSLNRHCMRVCTTCTFRLFPRALYLCLSVVESGKEKEGGNA